ncbi:MAG TPA: hypothetical protein VFY17_08270, partial [Pilimelia sp.]|nr:hypothetical protein [Pilimelia sp.]
RWTGFAVPVSLNDPARTLAGLADRVWAARVATHLGAVGAAYRDFREVTDEEVTSLLHAYRPAARTGGAAGGRAGRTPPT